MSILKFGNKKIGTGLPVIIIAEIGINHEGDINSCLEMIKMAAAAGADAVKLQTIDADENYVSETESYKLFKKSELTQEETKRAFDLARNLGIEIFTTAGDFKTIDWIDELAPAAHKVSSGLLTSLPIIDYLAKKNRTMLVSTGLASFDEIDEAINCIKKCNSAIAIFQCTSSYPTLPKDVNLSMIQVFHERYKVPVGLSDHSLGLDASVLSVACGAVMIERHFSSNKKRTGYDHHISLEPEEFLLMVKRIRDAEEFMGNRNKELSQSLIEQRKKANRCLITKRKIVQGEIFTNENIGIKRPLPNARGLDPKTYPLVLNKAATQNIEKDMPVMIEHVSELKNL